MRPRNRAEGEARSEGDAGDPVRGRPCQTGHPIGTAVVLHDDMTRAVGRQMCGSVNELTIASAGSLPLTMRPEVVVTAFSRPKSMQCIRATTRPQVNTVHMTTRARSTHHHGNLRAVLVQAAFEHVRNDGAASFSLRDATSSAGVTAGAAYRHFASRADLLAEVVVLGFAELSTSMRTHATTRPPDNDRGRLLATGEAYVDFARREPHLFTLMFGPDGATGRALAEHTDLGAPSASQQLRAALHEIAADNDSTFLHAWGLAHGLAGLAAAGITTPDEIHDALTAFTTTVAAGSVNIDH